MKLFNNSTSLRNIINNDPNKEIGKVLQNTTILRNIIDENDDKK